MNRVLLYLSFIFTFGLISNSNAQSVPCIDSSLIAPPICTFIYDPVCGCNGVTYSNLCIAQKTAGIAVWTQGPCNSTGCSANFTHSVSGNVATFTDGSGTGLNSWFWDFGDGTTSSMQNPVHTYANTGTYSVCLVIVSSTGCTDSSCTTVTVSSTSPPCVDSSLIDPFAICPTIFNPVCGCNGVTYSNNCVAEKSGGVTSYVLGACTSGGCVADYSYSLMAAPNSVAFFDSSTGGPFASWLWDFGDGNTSTMQNPTHLYAQPGTYTACLTVVSTTACVDTICQTINLTSVPCVDSSQIDSTTICLTIYDPVCGCNGVTYSNDCIAQYYGGVTSWTQGACTSGGGCQADFGYLTGINPLGLIFNDSSITSSPNDPITVWAWDFGDGNTSAMQNPAHVYAQPGNYTVCLTITTLSGCTDSICMTIPVSIGGGCQAAFTVIPDSSATPNYSFINNSSGTAPFNYFWDFGDGGTSTLQNPSHMYTNSGSFTVCLTITDSTGCTDTTCTTIAIGGGNCTAGFSYNVSPSGNVTFTNQSTGVAPLAYQWDLGDGSTSNQQDPQHLYATGGVYYVCLTVTDAANCTQTYCDSIAVIIQSVGSIIQNNFNLTAFPNPFEGQTIIQFELNKMENVSLIVYDLLGNKIETLVNEKQSSGEYRIVWNAKKYAPGLYFVSLSVGDKKVSTKLTLMK